MTTNEKDAIQERRMTEARELIAGAGILVGRRDGADALSDHTRDLLSWLLERCEQLEADAKRLDWLEAKGGVVAGHLRGDTLCGEAEFGWTCTPFLIPSRPLRQAIDAAMSPTKSAVAEATP